MKLLELPKVDEAIGNERALVRPEAFAFWTEQSYRCDTDSWAACLGFGKCRRDVMRRWGAKGTADSCVRTSMSIVEAM